MPCNAALSITKAAVTPAHLTKLLTPEVVEPAVRELLTKLYPGQVVVVRSYYLQTPNPLVVAQVGGYYGIAAEIRGNQVTVTTTYPDQKAQAEALAEQITSFLPALADRLFAAQIAQVMKARMKNVRAQEVTVNNQGQLQKAMQIVGRRS